MEITVTLDSSTSLADWLEAIGTLAAAVIALTVALMAWTAELRRRGQGAWTALYLVEGAAGRFLTFLDTLKDRLDPSGGLSTAKAQVLLPSGLLNELDAVFGELRPVDMPTRETADAYVSLRISIRDLKASIDFVANRPGSVVDIPLDRLWRQTQHTCQIFNQARARYAHPLWPTWLVKVRSARLWAARTRLARADAEKAKAMDH